MFSQYMGTPEIFNLSKSMYEHYIYSVFALAVRHVTGGHLH